MAPMSRGPSRAPSRVTKSKQKPRKFGTASLANHRFESFTQRISKLNIDPLRRNANARALSTMEEESSHFKASFDEWKDLNMSENFRTFAAELDPLCQTLPQIMHHQAEIVDLLVRYLEKRDEHSLEPLLSLVSHLAHDLGPRFEVYFARTVALISDIAATHQSIEVIEWSFTCLAYLFKFLSRLLISDLRPLYDLMAPLMGKTRQKHFVSRFAAESMSFLLKKAGARHDTDPRPLELIVPHVFEDLLRTVPAQQEQYAEAIATLFADAVKGVQRGLHSSGKHILGFLFEHLITNTALSSGDLSTIANVTEAVVINIIHYADKDGFAPVQQACLRVLDREENHAPLSQTEIFCRFLTVFVTVRKGTRILDWQSLVKAVSRMIDRTTPTILLLPRETLPAVLQAVVALLQYCPMDLVLAASQEMMPKLQSKEWQSFYLDFCVAFEKAGRERFDLVVLPGLQEFVISQWAEQEARLCLTLPELAGATATTSAKLALPSSWVAKMIEQFKSTSNGQRIDDISLSLLGRYAGLLQLASIDDGTLNDLANILSGSIAVSIRNPENHQLGLEMFLLGSGLKFVAGRGLLPTLDKALLQEIAAKGSDLSRNLAFLDSLEKIIDFLGRQEDFPRLEKVLEELLLNLSSPHHELRQKSLECAVKLLGLSGDETGSHLLEQSLNIERIPFTFDNSRAIAKDLRSLAIRFEESKPQRWACRAIAHHFLGFMFVPLAPVWDEAASAIKIISQNKDVEDTLTMEILQWLEYDADAQGNQTVTRSNVPKDHVPGPLTEFECSNLRKFDETTALTPGNLDSATDTIQALFKEETSLVSRRSSRNREQGLRLLEKIPQLAEKRSRQFVPCLLRGLRKEDEDEMEETADEPSSDVHTTMAEKSKPTALWGLSDKRTALSTIAQFVNPGVVFMTHDVSRCLLLMISNGDNTIQRNSLKALVVWKPVLKKYAENLNNLLDEQRFREELTIFLGLDRDEQVIEQSDRAGLMPVLLRLLYGRIISRAGTANMRRSQSLRRKAVLVAVCRLGEAELREFVKISLDPLDDLGLLHTDMSVEDTVFSREVIGPRKQLGVLRMVQDILETLPTHVGPFGNMIMDAVLYCAARADLTLHQPDETTGLTSLVKTVRHESLTCLYLLFGATETCDWSPYKDTVSRLFVRPRLANLPVETAQGISGVLRLFATWAASTSYHKSFEEDPSILEKTAECLVIPSAKDEVKIFILKEILDPLFAVHADHIASLASEHFLTSAGPAVIDRITTLVTSHPDAKCLQAAVQTLLHVGSVAPGHAMQKSLLQSFNHLLRQRSKVISLPIKADILKLLVLILPPFDLSNDEALFGELWTTIATMFSYTPRSSDRKLLVEIVGSLAKQAGDLQIAVDLVKKLNAVSNTRAGEPDFDTRLLGLNSISDFTRDTYSSRVWEMLLHNLLFLIRDNEELAMRSGASFSLQHFVEEATAHDKDSNLTALFNSILSPALQRGMSEPSELIKAEYLNILAKLVSAGASGFADMKCLLGTDEESSFFNNILHIQQHRRARALRRLAADASQLSSLNISNFCMPLVEGFYLTEDVDASLAMDAIHALKDLAMGLQWSFFKPLAQSLATSKQTYESKPRIRALGSVCQALFDARAQQRGPDVREVDEALPALSNLARTLPDTPILLKWLSNNILSRLSEFIHFKDESTVDLRTMVATTAVRLIMMFPEDEIAARLPPVLMDMSNVLKSRSQEARDTVRKTLAEISGFIGSRYIGFVLKQLKSSLQRGAHLHVLSYTLHSLMVQVTPQYKLGDLDYCVENIMAIVIEDIFGNVGIEKDAQEYVSKMKEVRKKSLSYDTLELLASITTIEEANTILRPIRAELAKLRPRLEKIEEVLRRVREGWRRNTSACTRQWLTLCYQVLEKAIAGADKNKQLQSPLSIKMASFSWDLLRRILDKHEELKTATNLTGFLGFMRFSFRQGNEEVQAAAMRFLTAIIKVPITEIDDHADEHVRLIKKTVEESSTTNDPLPQSAIRLLAALLRERPYAKIKESHFENHIGYVLGRIKPDLNEPARSGDREKQVAAFNLLRAVLNRGVIIKEVYEIMEAVREVMITTSDQPIPELSRSVYSRFVLDYFPEGGKGFQKQLDFLVTNLEYPAPNGRLSVMEVLLFFINKRDAKSLQPILLELFLPLVLVLGSDQSAECRNSARALLQRLVEKADADTTKALKGQLLTWIDSEADDMWNRIGFDFGVAYLSVHTTATKEAAALATEAARVVREKSNAKRRDALELLESALGVFQHLKGSSAKVAFAKDQQKAWKTIGTLVNCQSDKIKKLSAQLLASYLGHLVKTSSKDGADEHSTIPLTSDDGLTFDTADAVQAIEVHNEALRTTSDESTSDAIIQNLAFIGRLSASDESQDVLDSLLEKVAGAVRADLETKSMKPRLAALKLLHMLCKHVPLQGLEPTLRSILLSLNNLTDPAIPQPAATEPDETEIPANLTTTAQETLDLLQSKLGATAFVAALSQVQKEAKDRREQRKAKRRIEAVSQPERATKTKQRKHEASRTKRKEKNAKAAGMRRGW